MPKKKSNGGISTFFGKKTAVSHADTRARSVPAPVDLDKKKRDFLRMLSEERAQLLAVLQKMDDAVVPSSAERTTKTPVSITQLVQGSEILIAEKDLIVICLLNRECIQCIERSRVYQHSSMLSLAIHDIRRAPAVAQWVANVKAAKRASEHETESAIPSKQTQTPH